MEKQTSVDQKIISYLTFRLGDEIFAINVGKVINILELTPITKVPKSPVYIAGIINLRGEVLPVIDAKIKLSMGQTERTGNTCILIVETWLESKAVKFGALVDSVQEVLEIDDSEILPSPSVGRSYNNDLLNGVIENDQKFIMILDVNKLLSNEEILSLKNIQQDQPGEK